jgi:uncharacterized protein involved in exopolysaccharide biosynthesis
MDKTEENIPNPAHGYPPAYQYYPPEDEISLVDLWLVLVKRKKLILILTTVVTIVAILYAFFATPTAPGNPLYKAQVLFQPPRAHDIAVLQISSFKSSNRSEPVSSNRSELAIDTVTRVNSVFALVKKSLDSTVSSPSQLEKLGFLDALSPERDRNNNTIETYNSLGQKLTLTQLKEDMVLSMALSMDGNDPELITKIINRISEEAVRAATVELISGAQITISSEIEKLKLKIKLLREIDINQHKDDLAGLRDVDLYNLRLDLAWLESIEIDPQAVTAARLETSIEPPGEPTEPRRKLIVVLGFVLGFMLSIFAAFFAHFIEGQRKALAEAQRTSE